MDILILPGNSPHHREWSEQLKQNLEPLRMHTIVQQYQHWKTGREWASVDEELNTTIELTESLGEYVVLAKSIGSIIALKGTATGKIHPKGLLLMGIPLKDTALSKEVPLWLSQITQPIIVIQNSHDPLGSYDEVVMTLSATAPNLTVIEQPGDTHDYTNTALMSACLTKLS